jgi:hypothetical protein
MKLSQIFLEKFRSLDTRSDGRIFRHRLLFAMQEAKLVAARVDLDSELDDNSALIYTFSDRSRLMIENPNQTGQRAHFYILSNVG